MNFLNNIGGAIKSTFTSSGLDMPPYTPVESKENAAPELEERSYPDTMWVSTVCKGMTHRAATREGFWKLFNYIQGQNEAKMNIPMTAPVAVKVEPGEGPNCESSFTISFYISPQYQPSPPKPTDPSVFIDAWKPFTAYTRTYGGFSDDDTYVAQATALTQQVDSSKIHQNFYFTAGYDSPFKLFNRRNEIWFIKKSESLEPEK